MDNVRLAPKSGTFSRLFPESRCLNFRHSNLLPCLRLPDEYRCPTSVDDQTFGFSESANSGNLLDEMRAVQSSYTACIEDQDLPSSTQDLYRLITKMAADAVSGSDEHPVIPAETVNAVRCIDRYVRETTSDRNTLQQDLKKRADDNRLFRLHAHLGDYAGALCEALFAARSYARRNFICHGGIFDLFQSNNFAGLAEYIEADDKALEDILPDEEKPMVDKYRKLLTFYRDSHIRKNGQGEWEKKAPPSSAGRLPNPSVRSWGAELRTRIEMGMCRPSGLSGPPPVNVSFSPSAFRRQSDPEHRGIKRPAVEQPPGQPCVKAARGNDYPHVRLETIGAITDSDARGLQRLQLDLHSLSAELAYRSPTKSNKVLKQQIEQVGEELAEVGVTIRKACQRKGRPKGGRK